MIRDIELVEGVSGMRYGAVAADENLVGNPLLVLTLSDKSERGLFARCRLIQQCLLLLKLGPWRMVPRDGRAN